jgi:hypothetical protein
MKAQGSALEIMVDYFKWRAANLPTESIMSEAAGSFEKAVKTLPKDWTCLRYQLPDGTKKAMMTGPRYKWTIGVTAACTIKRILMDRCELGTDNAAAFAYECDAAARRYYERVRLYGRSTDRRMMRDEMQRLRAALKISEASKDFMLFAGMSLLAEHPEAAAFGDKGKSICLPDYLLNQIGAVTERLLQWLDENESCDENGRPKGGRPQQLRAYELIRILAKAFTCHTGKRATATPGTPFYEITRQVLSSMKLPGREPRKLIAAALLDPTGGSDKHL